MLCGEKLTHDIILLDWDVTVTLNSFHINHSRHNEFLFSHIVTNDRFLIFTCRLFISHLYHFFVSILKSSHKQCCNDL